MITKDTIRKISNDIKFLNELRFIEIIDMEKAEYLDYLQKLYPENCYYPFNKEIDEYELKFNRAILN